MAKATAAEEGAARTPRRHRRNLVAKKNQQQAPPTESGAVVEITNKAPYMGSFDLGCFPDEIEENINLAGGQSWSARSRGACLVTSINATLYLPKVILGCASYKSSGTSYSQFYIIMNNEDTCCVQSSDQSGVCDGHDCVCGWNPFCPGCGPSF